MARLSIAFGAVAVLAVVANAITEHGQSLIRVIEQTPVAAPLAAGPIGPDALPDALDRFHRAVLARVDSNKAARSKAHEEALAALETARTAYFAVLAPTAGPGALRALDAQLTAHLEQASALLRATDARRRLLNEFNFEFESLDARLKTALDRDWQDPHDGAAREALVEASRILDGIGKRALELALLQGYGPDTVRAISRGERAFASTFRQNKPVIVHVLGEEWFSKAHTEFEYLVWLRELLVRTEWQREGKVENFAQSHAALAAQVRKTTLQFEATRALASAQQKSADALTAITAEERRQRTLLVWLSVCVLLLLLATSISTVFSVVSPVRQLIGATQRIARGEPGVVVPRGGIKELDTLAVSFNEMARQLTAAQTAARQSHVQLEAKVEERTRQLKHLAAHDPLTRLPNRRQLLAQLAASLKRADERRELVGIFFLDLDHFKNINDSMGHLFGDRLLQAIAERLQQATAKYGFSARLGGDEFTVIYPGATHPDEIRTAGEQLVRAFQEPLVIEDHELLMGLSVGASVFPLHGREPEELLRAADAALFHAKARGRCQIHMFSPELLEAAASRFAIEQGLRRAVERGEFELAFQPQVSLASLEANVVEALLRWRMPDGTYAAPQDFMRVAEECGLIKDIGEWVLRSAVEQTAQWHRAGWREVRVAVNVSSLQLLDGHFAERLQELLRRHELPAHCIEIELTENVLQTGAHTIEALQQLHAAGIGIALDDFGAGYSSLVSLERLPLCRVKLDRNLIAGIDTSARCQAIAQATIALCQNLGLAVTAEGVERREQFAWLTAHPAIQLQGYLLSSPVPREDVLRVVAGMPDHMRTLLRPLPLAPTVRFSDYLESRKRHDR